MGVLHHEQPQPDMLLVTGSSAQLSISAASFGIALIAASARSTARCAAAARWAGSLPQTGCETASPGAWITLKLCCRAEWGRASSRPWELLSSAVHPCAAADSSQKAACCSAITAEADYMTKFYRAEVGEINLPINHRDLTLIRNSSLHKTAS